ncbi:DNA-binding NarL/FixJ family response regulator [Friedmanniella endophytica]|uniref:DNA-binding NarL/FixJ family response regulator n=1 Tax=Microlunatus kandeliicorticis TaxID=1759536 RepID=A0A7W3IP93_9ACTN|nr:response regulator transcription factor [Microlunatus kandeliicorticis]MBA8792680.1 DNA-binding NarL/FixJ family response regulator [Microlunatus kandeliicorticis]
MDAPIRVLVADDDPLARMLMVGRLGSEPGLEVVAEADDGAAVVARAAAARPDVVLLDFAMPDLDQHRVIGALSGAADGPAVILLTQFESDAVVDAALRAGARAQLVKTARQDELVRLIATVAAERR